MVQINQLSNLLSHIMKKNVIILSLVFLNILSFNVWSAIPDTRQRLLMDYNWKFIQTDVKSAETKSFDDSKWRTLNLPHDWSIEGEFKQDASTNGDGGYLPTGIGWYRKHFNLSSIPKDQQFWIEFEGVYMNSDVWINGQHLGKHPYGYTGFYYDLTPFVKEGENVIAVRVDNSLQPNSRWYSGSGIYRHVWLNIANPVHIAQWGTYIYTPIVDTKYAVVKVYSTIENKLPVAKQIVLRAVVKDKTGKEVTTLETRASLPASSKTDVEQVIKVNSPSLWSVESPTLYTLQSSIIEDTKVNDNVVSTFGIRKIEYDLNKGFLLNGEQVKMKGMALHHDAGSLGTAVPARAWERYLEELKAMGCNAIRTAHNPPSSEFLDLCDKMGFLVMDELFDEWMRPKIQGNVKYAYHLYFEENWKSDLTSFVLRDRNHPSVVMWSAGNEIVDAGDERGQVILKNLLDEFHKLDIIRPVLVANDRIEHTELTALPGFLDMQDLIGYNYVSRWRGRRELYYSVDKVDHPKWKMVGTEVSNVGGVRGSYSPFGFSFNKPTLQNGEAPAAPERSADYRTMMVAASQQWRFVAVNDYVIGDFMWTGKDYIGESRWPNKSGSSGVLDLCGFPKDGYYFWQSIWTTKPMAHVFPHWNWAGNEGKIVPVIVYTNCDSVELFLNGKSFGLKTLQFPQQSLIWSSPTAGAVYANPYVTATTSDLHLSWDVPYEPGTLKVIGKKNGIIVNEEVSTTSKPAAIRLSADRVDISADAHDIVNIKVEIIDQNGLVVPDANNPIEFKVEGEGVLAGTDNGNGADKTMMKSKQRNAFNGLALAVIQSTLKSGNIRISAVSPGLKDATLQVVSHTSDYPANTVESLK